MKFRTAALAAIVVNAFIQCLLVIPSPIPGKQTPLFILLTIGATVVYLWYLTVIVALKTAPETAGSAFEAMRDFRPRFPRFLAWLVGFSIVFTVGLFLWLIPGFVVLAIGPMVVLAAADGRNQPIRQNFNAIRHHFWGWLWRILVSGLLCLVAWLAAGLFMFLWVGAVGAFAAWIVVGIITWILTAMWVSNLRRLDAHPDEPPAPVAKRDVVSM